MLKLEDLLVEDWAEIEDNSRVLIDANYKLESDSYRVGNRSIDYAELYKIDNGVQAIKIGEVVRDSYIGYTAFVGSRNFKQVVYEGYSKENAIKRLWSLRKVAAVI